ncbi:uncharacterized protein LOC105208130 isoform X2 [Solenopsis invicta]|uniref:uncharacterized protein LOC105208130 isoform X2 n=1 Tax=Solenopsis invicta TaxID=13686 RepID=UPI000E33FDD0|nr:uncharacterized protein LOC105208130 isoform X2 [Solenopsis invicta]
MVLSAVKMTSNLLIFIPQTLRTEQSGYVLGKVIHDSCSDLKKFYVVSLRKTASVELTKSTLSVIGYYSNGNDAIEEPLERMYPNWVHIATRSCEDRQDDGYQLMNIVLNNKKTDLLAMRTMIVVYDQRALQETELFESSTASGDHFYELARLIQSKDELRNKSRFVRTWEALLTYHMSLYLYPVLLLSKVTERLLPVLKYSSLGLHVYDWLENVKWMLVTVVRNGNFKLKTGNYALAIVIDIALGIFILRLLRYYIEDQPSQLLLNNAEKVVETLKDLINWLMGVPAGLKLNHALNNTMGKFFLYHIQLWWTFLIFSKPLLDLAFEVLLLFGRLGITFQISIIADLLALALQYSVKRNHSSLQTFSWEEEESFAREGGLLSVSNGPAVRRDAVVHHSSVPNAHNVGVLHCIHTAQISVNCIQWLSDQAEVLSASYACLHFLEVVTTILQHLQHR